MNALCCERFGEICKADRLGITSKWGYRRRSNAADAPNLHNPKGWGTLALSPDLSDFSLNGRELRPGTFKGASLRIQIASIQQRAFTLFEQALARNHRVVSVALTVLGIMTSGSARNWLRVAFKICAAIRELRIWATEENPFLAYEQAAFVT